MLELPESITIARQLKETVVGKTIETVQAAQSPHGFAWYFGAPEEYPAMLEGKTITDAYAMSGWVEMRAEEMRIAFHDGVNIRYLDAGKPRPKKHQLALEFADGSAIYCTVQMYGGLIAFPAGAFQNPYYEVAQEKPSPLDDAFDWDYFQSIVRSCEKKSSVKALLATQQRIPGLGNGVLQDILWNAKLNPQTKLSKLEEQDLKVLYQSVKETLAKMVTEGGRNTEKDLFGKEGGYFCALSSKTLPHPCRRCGGGLTRKAYMGGNVYFCEACQPLLK